MTDKDELLQLADKIECALECVSDEEIDYYVRRASAVLRPNER